MAIYLALGANQLAQYQKYSLTPAHTFKQALALLKEAGVDVLSASNLWQSPAWPDPDAQAPYINAVIKVETKLSPIALLALLKKTEAAFGREASARNAPRSLDLDILDFDGQVLDGEKLTLPHPRMLSRPFVLMPLAEVAPDWHSPQKKRTLQDWTARLALDDVAPMKRLGVLNDDGLL